MPFSSTLSPDGQYQVDIELQEAFGFGPQDVRVAVWQVASEKQTARYTFTLANDGGTVFASDLQLTFEQPGMVHVCARGEEQPDTWHTIPLDGGKAQSKIGCP